jgi:protein-S-isoprenylcysteine O-methyltransferase Ste14
MENTSEITPAPLDTNTSRLATRRMIQVVIQFLIIALILFVCAGRLDWGWAWAYLATSLGILAVNAAILPPELIAERSRVGENAKRWDKVLSGLNLFPVLGALIVAGLDERLGWSPSLALGIHLGGLAVFALGQGLFSWAMASNKFFSTLVRIQQDRGHRVAASGPYRYVRHPGYAGFIAYSVAGPLALGSLWALIPAGITVVLFVIRTVLEDRTLQEELEGYRGYAGVVRHRLIPGVW